jgi:hypothetical protein
VPRSRIRGFIHLLLHTFSWRSAELIEHRDNFTLQTAGQVIKSVARPLPKQDNTKTEETRKDITSRVGFESRIAVFERATIFCAPFRIHLHTTYVTPWMQHRLLSRPLQRQAEAEQTGHTPTHGPRVRVIGDGTASALNVSVEFTAFLLPYSGEPGFKPQSGY